jgi:TonB family protein
MVGLRLVSVAVLATVIAYSATTTPPGASHTGGNQPVDAQANKEFQAQVAAVVQAYRKHDAAKGRQLIDQFRLQNPQDWFAAHLNPSRSAEFASRYDRIFTSFADEFERTVEDIAANKGAELGTEVQPGDGQTPSGDLIPGAKRSGVVSTSAVELFFCSFHINIKKTFAGSWGETYVHDNGAFRFLGFGGWPFWVWQDGTEGRGWKNGRFGTPAVLVSRVDPVYPLQAKANKIQGLVALHIRIDKEGRVEDAQIMSGDPSLSQAAIEAVRQWRYKPATLAGNPIATDGTAEVVFALH